MRPCVRSQFDCLFLMTMDRLFRNRKVPRQAHRVRQRRLELVGQGEDACIRCFQFCLDRLVRDGLLSDFSLDPLGPARDTFSHGAQIGSISRHAAQRL